MAADVLVVPSSLSPSSTPSWHTNQRHQRPRTIHTCHGPYRPYVVLAYVLLIMMTLVASTQAIFAFDDRNSSSSSSGSRSSSISSSGSGSGSGSSSSGGIDPADIMYCMTTASTCTQCMERVHDDGLSGGGAWCVPRNTTGLSKKLANGFCLQRLYYSSNDTGSCRVIDSQDQAYELNYNHTCLSIAYRWGTCPQQQCWWFVPTIVGGIGICDETWAGSIFGFIASATLWWLLDRWIHSQIKSRPWARDSIGRFRPAGDLLPGGLYANHNLDGTPLTEMEEEHFHHAPPAVEVPGLFGAAAGAADAPAAGGGGAAAALLAAPPVINRCGSCEMAIGGPAPAMREFCHGCAYIAAPLVEGASYDPVYVTWQMPTLLRFVCAYLVINLHYFLAFEESVRNWTAVGVVLLLLNIFMMMASTYTGVLMGRTPFDRVVRPWLCGRNPNAPAGVQRRRAPPNGLHPGLLQQGELLDGMALSDRRVLLQYCSAGERVILNEHTSIKVLMRHTRLKISIYSMVMLLICMIPALILSLTATDAAHVARVGFAIAIMYAILIWIFQIAPAMGWLTITDHAVYYTYAHWPIISYMVGRCGLFAGATTVRFSLRPHSNDHRPIFEFRSMGLGAGELSLTILPKLVGNGPRHTLFCYESLDDIRIALSNVGYNDHDYESFMTPFPPPLPITFRRRVCCTCDGDVRWSLFVIRVIFVPAIIAILLTWVLIIDENTASPAITSYRLQDHRVQWYSTALPALVTAIISILFIKTLHQLLCARKLRTSSGAVAPLLGGHIPLAGVGAANGGVFIGVGIGDNIAAASAASNESHNSSDGPSFNYRMYSGDAQTRARIFALLPVPRAVSVIDGGQPLVPEAALAAPICESIELWDDEQQRVVIHDDDDEDYKWIAK